MKKKTFPMVLDSNEPRKLKAKSKRNRKLPQKDIIDADFFSPSSSRIMDDLLLIQTPSQHDRVILSELWGNSSQNNGFNSSLPHVSIGKPKRSEISSNTTTTTTIDSMKHYKSYKDKLLETKKNDLPMDLSNLTLIPSFAKERKQQYDFEQDAIGVDYLTDDFRDTLAINEHVNKDGTIDKTSNVEGSQLVDHKQSQDTTNSSQSEQSTLVEANNSKGSIRDEGNLSLEYKTNSNNIDQKHVENPQTKETGGNLEENIQQSIETEPEKELITNTKTAVKVTCINQAGPVSDLLESLDPSVSNDTEKICQKDDKEPCLDQKQSVLITDRDPSVDNDTQLKETSVLVQDTALPANNSQDLGNYRLELEINTVSRTLDPNDHSISQDFDSNLEILPINTNDDTPSASLTACEYKEAQIENNADTHVAEPNTVDKIQDRNNTIITAPSPAPNMLQDDSRLEVMEHQSSSSSSSEDDDEDESWMEDHQDEEDEDNVYSHIFQLMSVPKPTTIDSKAVPKVTIMTKPSIIRKLGPRKEYKRLLLSKNSAALDWIENGCNNDKKKKMLSTKRKRQLSNKLEQPYIIRKRIKSYWKVE
jgi:hypothetical protein